tara:strand:- start:318 stop:839 length:522 start_codon:yes stop_codon:yes gene_type:complete
MTEDFNPITLEGLNSSSEVHYFNNNVSFFEPVDVFGGLQLQSTVNVEEIFEKVCVYDDASYGEVTLDIGNGSLHNLTNEPSTNFTFNIKGLGGVVKGKSIVVTVLINMGSSAYVMSNPSTTGFKIDDKTVVVKWINSTPPSSGFTNAVNAYTFAIIKNDTSDYTVLGTLSSFG